jgi:hypothetical protein
MGILVPALCLVFLSKKKKDLDELYLKLRFGFLYNGFKPKTFFWEFIVLYRKVLFITISVFLPHYSLVIQAQTVFLILLIYLLIQQRYQPYSTDDLNNLEIYSILVSCATIYAGLYYLSGDLTYELEVSLFIVIVLFNLLFMQLWLRRTLKMFMGILESKFPNIGQRFKNIFMRNFNVHPVNSTSVNNSMSENFETKMVNCNGNKDERIHHFDLSIEGDELFQNVIYLSKPHDRDSGFSLDEMYSKLKSPLGASHNSI